MASLPVFAADRVIQITTLYSTALRRGLSMDIDDTPEEAAFRAEARTWLDGHAERRSNRSPAQRSRWRDPSPEAQAVHVAACQAWQRTLFEGGWAGITWPQTYGGRGGTSMQQ